MGFPRAFPMLFLWFSRFSSGFPRVFSILGGSTVGPGKAESCPGAGGGAERAPGGDEGRWWLEHDFYDFLYIGNMGTNNPNDPIKSDSSISMWYGNVVTNSSDSNQAFNISAGYLLGMYSLTTVISHKSTFWFIDPI